VVTENTKFIVVNAFAEGAFGGNPAGVFPDAEGLDDETMQAMARQLNLVESVFVLPCEEADVHLRYFTPNGEVPVAGHPSVATWLALLHLNRIDAKQPHYTQKNLAGIQDIEIDLNQTPGPVITMKQPQPEFLEGNFNSAVVAETFGLRETDLDDQLPIQAVDCGLGHLIVPVRTLDALMRAQRNIEQLRQICQKARVREAQLFCFETINKEYDIHTRNLCPRQGLEDPACGNGNGALGAYLGRYYWTQKKDFTIKCEQGHIVKMPSMIQTRTVRNGRIIDVYVGGTGIVMLEGTFLV